MAGIGIITNPHSRLNKRYPQRREVLSFLMGEKGVLRCTESLDDLTLAAQEFAKQEVSVLAINGGDGTVSRTLTAFIHAYKTQKLPKILILRGGTVNVLAENLGIRSAPEKALFQLVETLARGEELKTIFLNTLQFQEQFGFLFADLTSAAFLKKFYEHKTSAWGAIRLACEMTLPKNLSTVVRSSEVRVRVSKAQTISARAVGFFCSTFPKMPLGLPFFSTCPPLLSDAFRDQSQKLHAVLVTAPPKKLPLRMPSLLFSRKKCHPDKIAFATHEQQLQVSYSSPYPVVTLDGELFRPVRLEEIILRRGPELEFVLI